MLTNTITAPCFTRQQQGGFDIEIHLILSPDGQVKDVAGKNVIVEAPLDASGAVLSRRWRIVVGRWAAAESSTDNDEDSAASEIESQPREYDDVKSPQFMALENSAVKK